MALNSTVKDGHEDKRIVTSKSNQNGHYNHLCKALSGGLHVCTLPKQRSHGVQCHQAKKYRKPVSRNQKPHS